MTPERVVELAAAVRVWPRTEQLAWRRLLDVAPREAVMLAELALELAAVPVDPVTFDSPLRRGM